MSPLMQAICDHLSDNCTGRYIDSLQLDANALERGRLRQALAAALPDSYQELLDQYDSLCLCRINMEIEAMFQAAFAAAKELA